jgi:YVTN family beta-propeller protein
MTDAPNTSSYVLTNPDTGDLPNSRTLTAGTGIGLADTGSGGTITPNVVGNLSNLFSYNQTGYVAYNNETQTFGGRTFISDFTLLVNNGDGTTGANTTFQVIPDTTIQQVQVYQSGSLISTRSAVNFISGSNIGLSVSDDFVNNRANITISAPGAEPISPNLESIAALTPSAGNLIVGNGTGYSALSIGAAGMGLVSDGTTPHWAPLSGSGTVTSVGATTTSTGLSISGSPITTSGSLTFTLNAELQGLAGLNADGILIRTGAGTYTSNAVTQHDILIGGASNSIVSQPLTNGQLLIGSTGASPNAATLTAGSGISISTSAGSITINNTSPSSGGTVTSITAGSNLTGGTITSSGTIALSNTVSGLTSLGVENLSLGGVSTPSTINCSSGDLSIKQSSINGNVIISSNGTGTVLMGTGLSLTGTFTLQTGGFIDWVNNLSGVPSVYNVLPTDSTIIVNTTSSSPTINLPASPTTGRTYKVIDGSGNASNNPIYFNGNGNLINGTPSTLTDLAPVSLGGKGNPGWSIISPNGQFLYVATNDMSGSYITVISNASSNSPTFYSNIPVSTGILYFAISPDGNYLYADDQTDITIIQNASTNPSLLTTITIPNSGITIHPSPNIVFTPNGNYVYVNYEYTLVSDFVAVCIIQGASTTTPSILTSINTGTGVDSNINQTVISNDGNYAYVLNNGYITVIQDASGSPSILTSAFTPPGTPYLFSMVITYDNNYGYVTDNNQNVVYQLNNISSGTISITATINVGSSPANLILSPDNQYLYVNNSGTNTISVIKYPLITNPQVIATVIVGFFNENPAITSDGKYLFTSNLSSATVSTVAVGNDNPIVIDTILLVGSALSNLVVTPNNKYLYVNNTINPSSINFYPIPYNIPHVSNEFLVGGSTPSIAIFPPSGNIGYTVNNTTSDVSIINNTSTNSPFISPSTIPVGSNPEGGAITPDGNFLYVPNSGDDTVSVIVGASTIPTFLTTITVGNGPTDISITPNGNFAYAPNNSDDTVSVIQGASSMTPTLLTTITVGNNPSVTLITPNGNFVYVTNSGDDTVSVIQGASTTTPTLLTTITVGSNPNWVSVTPNGNFAYIANSGDGTVSVIQGASTTTPTLLTTITVGAGPVEVFITPNGNFAYVSNFSDDTVSVIQGASSMTPTLLTTIPVGGGPTGVSTPPNSNFAYVTNQTNNTLSFIQSASNVSETISSNYGEKTLVYSGSQWLAYPN